MSKTKVKQQRCVYRLHSSVSDMSDFLTESGNSFQVPKEYFLNLSRSDVAQIFKTS